MRSPLLALAALALAVLGAPATLLEAQSLTATRGLGYEISPQDDRSRALGGVALGLPEPEISWANPAGVIGFLAPGLTFSYQYDNFSADRGEVTSEGESARFPMILAAFPIGNRIVLMGGFGSFLDQNWRMEEPDTLILGLDTIPTIDRLSSEGGASRLRLGGAFQIREGLGVGFGVDFYTGDVLRQQGRTFGAGFQSTTVVSRWDYSGVGYSFGARWSPGPVGGIGAAMTIGGKLDASPRNETAEARSYDLPISIEAGASGRIQANTLVALSGRWSGWSSADDDLSGGFTATDTWSLHGGVEYDALSIAQRTVPVRLGARTGTLPFRGQTDGDDSPTERALSGGFGAMLAGGAVRPDFAFEVGRRANALGTNESFWRFGFSIRVIGL